MKPNIKRISDKEVTYVKEVLDSDFRGPRDTKMLRRAEEAFSKRMGVQYSIGHINGTATLHSALYAAGVRAGDEVIVPPLTMAATTMAVLQQDAVPVFADVDEETLQIDPKSIEKLITPRTKAIITVALYGLSPDMDPIMELAKKHNLKVIEDNAQCFLGEYKGRLAGTIGHFSSFSFQSTKHLTAGEGGMVCTNDVDAADLVRRFAVLGYASVSAKAGKISKDDIQNPNYSRHASMGYNYRMPDLCAAVTLAQIERIDELVQRRIDSANLFMDAMKGCDWLVPQYTPEGYKNVYWGLAVRLVNAPVSWVDFRMKFKELGGDGIYATWKLTYQEPMFQTMDFAGKEDVIKATYKGTLQDWKPGLCPVAEKVQQQILAFKTNYWEWDRAEKQAELLKQTIAFFNNK
jgi:perosamine synthetase